MPLLCRATLALAALAVPAAAVSVRVPSTTQPESLRPVDSAASVDLAEPASSKGTARLPQQDLRPSSSEGSAVQQAVEEAVKGRLLRDMKVEIKEELVPEIIRELSGRLPSSPDETSHAGMVESEASGWSLRKDQSSRGGVLEIAGSRRCVWPAHE